MKALLGAALSLSLVTLPANAEEVPVSREASEHFARGVKQLTSTAPERFRSALDAFKAAYTASPSWKILGNLGIAAEALERDGEAIDAFAKYVAQGRASLSAEELSQYEADLQRLRAGSTTFLIRLSDRPTWITDERHVADGSRLTNRYGPFRGNAILHLRAGQHRLSTERPGLPSHAWQGKLAAGATVAIELDRAVSSPVKPTTSPKLPLARVTPSDPSRTPRDWRGGAYTAWGVTVLSSAATAALFLTADTKDREGDQTDCTPFGPDPEDCKPQKSLYQRAANWRTASAIGAGLAGTAFLTGGLLYWLSDPEPTSSNDSQTTVRLWLSPSGVGLTGRF